MTPVVYGGFWSAVLFWSLDVGVEFGYAPSDHMLMLRLARIGKRSHASFRIVATEHTRPPKSGSLEQLGSYDPHTNQLRVDAERVKTHLAHGAQLSPTLHNLLIENKVIEGTKVVAWRPKKKAAEAVSPRTTKDTGRGPSTTEGTGQSTGQTAEGPAATEAPAPAGEQPAA